MFINTFYCALFNQDIHKSIWFSGIQKSKGTCMYSGTCELRTPKGLSKTVRNSEVVLFLMSISMYMYWIELGTEVVVLNSQVVPNSQVVVKRGFTVVTVHHVFI